MLPPTLICASSILGLELAGQGSWLVWLLVGAALGLLTVGGDRAVSGAARLASAMGVSKVIIGATIVSLGTTSAEVFVSVTAAFRGQGDLAMGNAVGSIIVDSSLIFGLGCVLTSLPKDRFVLRRQGVVKISCVALLTGALLLLAWGRGSWEGVTMPRFVGGLFVGGLILYMVLSVRWAKAHPEFAAAEVDVTVDPEKLRSLRRHRSRAAAANLALLALGLGLVLAGSHVLLVAVEELCVRYRVPPDVMAVTLIAFGTSLPELVTAIASVVKKHPELLVGNVLGADILNVLCVAGLSATAVPLTVSASFFSLHLPVMCASSLLLGAYIFTGGRRFPRWQGLPLLALYVAYCLLLLRTV